MRVTAVFETRTQAEQALTDLRQMGAGDAHLSVLSRHAGAAPSPHRSLGDVDEGAGPIVIQPSGVAGGQGLAGMTDAATDASMTGDRALGTTAAGLEGLHSSPDHPAGLDWNKDIGGAAATGAVAGIGTGALVGLALALIPGIGPFLGAGVLAGSIGAGVATGAVAGGAVGSLVGALGEAGYNEEESGYYAGAVERGGVLVAVDTDANLSAPEVQEVLRRHGGQSFGVRTGG